MDNQLFAEEQLSSNHWVLYHHSVPVLSAVECELPTTGKLVPDFWQHGILIIIIELIVHINEECSPIFQPEIMLPHQPHCIYPNLNIFLHPSTHLICSTGLLSLRTSDFQDTILHTPPSIFSESNHVDSQVFVKLDKPLGHHHPIQHPRRPMFIQPPQKRLNNHLKVVSCPHK